MLILCFVTDQGTEREVVGVAAQFRPTVVAATDSFLGDVAASSWPAVEAAAILRRCGVTLRYVGALVGLVLFFLVSLGNELLVNTRQGK